MKSARSTTNIRFRREKPSARVIHRCQDSLNSFNQQMNDFDVNLLDAASRGVGDGLFLALNVGAMLIAFVGLIGLCNGILGVAHTNMQTLFGWALAPVAWIIGVPWHDAKTIGFLMGTKVVLNEFVAFSMLAPMKGHIATRSFTIATYALCGFANFSSIGIQIGGIGALAPSRKHDLARLGFRALVAGTLANYLAAAIAGLRARRRARCLPTVPHRPGRTTA